MLQVPYGRNDIMTAAQRRASWAVTRCESLEDMRLQHVRTWQALSSAERMDAAWDLVKEAWALQKRNLDELRLQRSITVVRKA